MNKIWKILNAPLVVVLIALAIWPILTVLSSGVAVKLGMEKITETVGNEVVEPLMNMTSKLDERFIQEAAVINKVVISNIAFAPTSQTKKIKTIGTVTNNAKKAIKSVNLTASFYQNGKLVNVHDKWLSRPKVIPAGASTEFSFQTNIQENQNAHNLTVKIKVTDLSVLE